MINAPYGALYLPYSVLGREIVNASKEDFNLVHDGEFRGLAGFSFFLIYIWLVYFSIIVSSQKSWLQNKRDNIYKFATFALSIFSVGISAADRGDLVA